MNNEHNEAAEGEHHFRGATPEATGVAIIDGPQFVDRVVHYVDVDGNAVVEGDILIGRTDELREVGDESDDSGLQSGVAIQQERYRWTNGVVPYTIASGFAASDRLEILSAIAHWRDKTNIQFVQRTTQANYVTFTPGVGCSSFVGMRGGAQAINLMAQCSLGSVIHEIGHAVGLWHEQSREDRDTHVTVNYANIEPAAVNNFNRQVANGVDVGSYDYGSIMHYGRTAFSRNGRETITPKRAGAVIGQRTGLSPGDIAAVRWMYPNLEASRTWQGVQFRASVPANSTRTWSTHSWPSYWYVDWSVMPVTPIGSGSQQLSVDVRVARQDERLVTYYLRVTNHSSQGVSFEGRYAVLGWSRAARDAEDAADAMSEGGQVSDDLLLALGDGSQSLPSADLEIDREPVSAGMANGHR